jgi:CheY-like chemotaxis protein
VLDEWLPRLLRDAGYRVFSVTSGEEMRQLAIAACPDVVIVEGILEDMAGTQACRVLRSDPAIPRHLPILLVVDDHPSPALRLAAVREGVWGFIIRRELPADILHTVAAHVEANRSLAAGTDDGYHMRAERVVRHLIAGGQSPSVDDSLREFLTSIKIGRSS